LFGDLENKIPLKKVEKSTLMERLMMEQEVFKTFISWNPLDWLYKFAKKRTLLSNIKDKTDVGNFEIVWYVKEIRRAKKKWFFVTIEDISDNMDIFLNDTYWLEKFDLVIISWWKKNRIQISKIVKTSRDRLKELAWGSYDEKDTVSVVKKARAGEQQQLNLERIKAEIAEQNEKMAEENKENLTKNISSEENETVEDAESENVEVDEELNEIEEESVDEDISEEDIIEEEDVEQPSLESQNNNLSSWTEGEGSYVGDTDDTQDSSAAPQNDDNLEKSGVPMDSSLHSEWQTNSENEEIFTITSENLAFSKMKQLMTIVSWNPWDIVIQVLWNEMKVSEKWLEELKKLIQE